MFRNGVPVPEVMVDDGSHIAQDLGSRFTTGSALSINRGKLVGLRGLIRAEIPMAEFVIDAFSLIMRRSCTIGHHERLSGLRMKIFGDLINFAPDAVWHLYLRILDLPFPPG